MAFDEIQFPTDISYGSTGGPEYSTDVVMMTSGHERRNSNWSSARARYNVAHGVKTQAQLDSLVAFFRARKGRARGFRFKDWTDFRALNQQIGIGDNSEKSFQLVKRYLSGGVEEVRTIKKPVNGTVDIYINSILQTSGYTVSYTTGLVTFTVAPSAAAVIAADFEFDVPTRFDTDRLSASLESYGVYAWNEIPLVEVRV